MLQSLLPLALVGAVALVVLVLFLAVRAVVEWRSRRWKRRLWGPEEDDEAAGILLPQTQPATTFLGRMDEGFNLMIQRCGPGWTAPQALGTMLLMGLLLGGVPLIWNLDFITAAIGFFLGMALCLAYFLFLQSRWRLHVQDQLPDAFFLIARSLKAGLNLEQSLATVATHGTQPLAGEFKKVVEQVDLGLAVPVALQNMARRFELPDFNVFVTAVALHRTMGGNLALLLERVATGTRDRNLFRGYYRAATALGRITAVCIALAAPVLFAGYAFWQLDFVSRFTDTVQGFRALGAASILEIIGCVWLYLLLRIDY
jgi:tight adherence protein B